MIKSKRESIILPSILLVILLPLTYVLVTAADKNTFFIWGLCSGFFSIVFFFTIFTVFLTKSIEVSGDKLILISFFGIKNNYSLSELKNAHLQKYGSRQSNLRVELDFGNKKICIEQSGIKNFDEIVEAIVGAKTIMYDVYTEEMKAKDLKESNVTLKKYIPILLLLAFILFLFDRDLPSDTEFIEIESPLCFEESTSCRTFMQINKNIKNEPQEIYLKRYPSFKIYIGSSNRRNLLSKYKKGKSIKLKFVKKEWLENTSASHNHVFEVVPVETWYQNERLTEKSNYLFIKNMLLRIGYYVLFAICLFNLINYVYIKLKKPNYKTGEIKKLLN